MIKSLFLSIMAIWLLSWPAGLMAQIPQPFLKGLKSPVGLAYDRQGNLYVAEWGGDQVSRFDPQGRRSLVTGEIKSPAGLAFDPDGNLFIASYADDSIYCLAPGGGLRKVAGGLASPTGLLWTRTNELLVANRNAGEVVKLGPGGRKKVLSGGHPTPVGLAQTKSGLIFISCYGGQVDLIDPTGKKIRSITSLKTPGVGIVDDDEEVLLVDYGAGTVSELKADGRTRPLVSGLNSPAALVRAPGGRFLVGTWGDGALFSFSRRPEL